MENKEIKRKDLDVLERIKELLNKKMYHKYMTSKERTR